MGNEDDVHELWPPRSAGWSANYVIYYVIR